MEDVCVGIHLLFSDIDTYLTVVCLVCMGDSCTHLSSLAMPRKQRNLTLCSLMGLSDWWERGEGGREEVEQRGREERGGKEGREGRGGKGDREGRREGEGGEEAERRPVMLGELKRMITHIMAATISLLLGVQMVQ